MPKVLTLFLLFMSFIVFAEETTTTEKKIKILILEFDNQQKVKEMNYLRQTILSVFSTKLNSEKKYTIVSLEELTGKTADQHKKLKHLSLYRDDIALGLGREAKADVVVTGNYAFLGKKVFIQAKALDVSRTDTIVSKSITGNADTSLFTSIGKVAKETSVVLDEKLANWSKQEKSEIYAFNQWNAEPFYSELLIGWSLPLADFSSALKPSLQLASFTSYKLIWFEPVTLSLSGKVSYSNYINKDSYNTTLDYTLWSITLGGEFSYPILMEKDKDLLALYLTIMPGYARSTLERGLDGKTYTSGDAIVSTMVSLRWFAYENFALSIQSSYEKVMFTGTQISAFGLGVSIGYRY